MVKVKRKKGWATEIILNVLQYQAEFTADVFDNFMCSYHESYRKMHGKMKGTIPRVKFEKNWADLYRERQKFYSTMTLLKKNGLVVKKVDKKGSKWEISEKGREKLKFFRKNIYEKEVSALPIIFSYDIPEEKRKERGWLREVLRELDYEMIHQSVWVGKIRIPEDLIHELRRRELLGHVHILEIGKLGTVEAGRGGK